MNTLYGFEMLAPDGRRRPNSTPRTIKRLWQRSHEIIGLALCGIKQKDIAAMLGIHETTVSVTLNSPLAKEKLSRLRRERDEDFKKLSVRVFELTEKALDVYDDIFSREDCDLKLKKETADTVALEMGGLRVPTKIDTRSLHATASLEEIEEFRRRGIQAAKESGFLAVVPGETKNVSEETTKSVRS